MTYGPQDWELLTGMLRADDPRIWRHKACGKRLEYPDDTHQCPIVVRLDQGWLTDDDLKTE